VPIVAVDIWYHVGSRNERRGRTGFAHLFEHLMFEGSEHVPPGEFDRLLEEQGGFNNGSTSTDRTNYWITVPSHALELALFLEADRMGWLEAAITAERLEAQRSVVMNERRQNYENRPYGLAHEKLFEALYPPEHPYHWPIIGWMDDIRAATLADVLDFFRRYYGPGNATLAIAGAVPFAQARDAAERYFADIPTRSPVAVVQPTTPALLAPRRIVLPDDVHLPRLYMGWHSPATFAPGDAVLDMTAHVLAHGKSGRLYRRLVYDLEIAQDLDAYQDSGLLGSTFVVEITARPGVPLERLEAEVNGELRRLADHGVETDELERARNIIQTTFFDSLETVGGFGGKADRLNLYAFYAHDPGYVGRDLARYSSVTPDAVRLTVGQWLIEAASVTLHVVPVVGAAP
jgi:zinc protease